MAPSLSAPALCLHREKTDEDEGYKFDTVKVLPITSVKNQNNAGTCWCYSGLAFIESELLRMGKGEYDLSEMYIVANTYNDRAAAAVRTHGDVSFSQGGAFNDVIYGMKTFGLVPEEVMRPGAMYGDTLSNHTELSAITDAIVNAIAKNEKLKKGNHSFEVGLDPSGIVYEAVQSNLLEGVTATLYDIDNAEDWDAASYMQENPQITGTEGFYAWFVPSSHPQHGSRCIRRIYCKARTCRCRLSCYIARSGFGPRTWLFTHNSASIAS